MTRLLAVALLAGCASTPPATIIREPVEVPIAVPVPCEPPAELLAPLDLELPEFVQTCPPATSGLTPEGEQRLMRMLWKIERRLAAWKAHAAECRN